MWHFWRTSCLNVGILFRTDRQTDGRTDRRTDIIRKVDQVVSELCQEIKNDSFAFFVRVRIRRSSGSIALRIHEIFVYCLCKWFLKVLFHDCNTKLWILLAIFLYIYIIYNLKLLIICITYYFMKKKMIIIIIIIIIIINYEFYLSYFINNNT